MHEYSGDILLGRKFKKMTAKVFDPLRKRSGLRQIEAELLLYLSKVPGASASEISRSLNLNKGQVSIGFMNLCKKGFIKCYPDENDHRVNGYHLTEKGEDFIREGDELRKEILSRLTEGISEDELDIVRDVSERIIKNIDKWI